VNFETRLVGEMAQGDTPDWKPLVGVVGEDIAGAFMWMYEIRTTSGAPLHAYKHVDTREYLHLDREGNAYAYVPESSYHSIPILVALKSVLRPWWDHLATLDEVLAAWAAIEAAGNAGRGQDPSPQSSDRSKQTPESKPGNE
jgi:hypothetical protein